MKKLLFALFCAIVIPASAQLQIKSEGATEYLHKGSQMSVTKTGNSYDLEVSDVHRTGTMVLHLGDSLSQAKETYKQIGEWFMNAENKTSIVVQGKEGDLTLYRHDGVAWIMTEGNGDYARKTYNDLLRRGLVGGPLSSGEREKPKFGYITYTQFGDGKVEKIFSE